MSTWIERAQAELDKHKAALRIIEGLAEVVTDALEKPDGNAHEALRVVERALDTLIKGFDGKVTHDEVDKLIRDMADRRTGIDAAEDDKLDAKFAKSDGTE